MKAVAAPLPGTSAPWDPAWGSGCRAVAPGQAQGGEVGSPVPCVLAGVALLGWQQQHRHHGGWQLRQPWRELSGGGARKDVTSRARVKVAIYKRVIAGVTAQLSPWQRGVSLFISPARRLLRASLPPGRAASQRPGTHRPGPAGARGLLPGERGLASLVCRLTVQILHTLVSRGFLQLCQMHRTTHPVHKHHAYVNTRVLFCLMS